MLFSKAASSFDLGNGAQLAAQIGGAAPTGMRLVDNEQSAITYNSIASVGTVLYGSLTPSSPADLIDTADFVSWNLLLTPQAAAGSTIAGAGISMEIQVRWWIDDVTAGNGVRIASEERFEIPANISPIGGPTYQINNKTGARYMTVSVSGWNATALVGPTVYAVLNLSNTPTDLLSIGSAQRDGFLGQQNGALASGISAAPLLLPLASGLVAVSLVIGAAASSWKLAFSNGYSLAAAKTSQFQMIGSTAGTQSQLWTFPLTNRPGAIVVTNSGPAASTAYNLMAWTAGD